MEHALSGWNADACSRNFRVITRDSRRGLRGNAPRAVFPLTRDITSYFTHKSHRTLMFHHNQAFSLYEAMIPPVRTHRAVFFCFLYLSRYRFFVVSYGGIVHVDIELNGLDKEKAHSRYICLALSICVVQTGTSVLQRRICIRCLTVFMTSRITSDWREKNDSIWFKYANEIKFHKRTRVTAGKATYHY